MDTVRTFATKVVKSGIVFLIPFALMVCLLPLLITSLIGSILSIACIMGSILMIWMFE